MGGTVGAESVSIPTPAVDDSTVVDFHPQAGRTLTVHLVGEGRGDLRDGIVSVIWNHEGTWQRLECKTGPDGMARFRNCVLARVWIRARCAGFAATLLDAFDVDKPPAIPLLVSLKSAGKITGRCSHAGAPVSDFEVWFWQGSPDNVGKHIEHNNRDGRFVIDEIPLGEVEMFAMCDDYPQSKLVRLAIGPDIVPDVDFEMPSPLLGRGQVVDAMTGQPLSDAKIQIYSLNRNYKARAWRGPQTVDSKGEFAIEGFSVGDNNMMVSAPGYASRDVSGIGVPGHELAFGLIGLFGKQSVDVQLTSETKVDFTQYKVAIEGLSLNGMKPFPADGHAVYPSLDPGKYTVRVESPDYNLMFDNFLLQPGKDVHVVVPLSARHLRVDIVPSADAPLPPGAILKACFKTTDGRSIEHFYRIAPDSHVDVPRVEGSEIVLQVEEAEEVVLGVEHFALTPTGPDAVTIHLDAQERRFRVVGAAGNRLPGVHVTLTLPGDSSSWTEYLETNGDGECSIRGLMADKVFVQLFENSIGFQPSTLVDLSAMTHEPLELKFAPNAALQVVALERQTPMPAVDLHARDQQGVTLGLEPMSTDSNGIATWKPVGAGDFKISVMHPGFWPSEQLVHCTQGGGPVPIQVRRVGGIEFTARNNYESPMPGLALDVYNVEHNAWASQWIHSGLLVGPTDGLVTDANGRLRLNALPNGPYHWRLTKPDGVPIEGDVTIGANTTASVAVLVP
jgi:hypothetical protein